tara:strand:+ start:15415 stop:15891 length:477 start_codon:yes stop_codon:yes gene_type:complete
MAGIINQIMNYYQQDPFWTVVSILGGLSTVITVVGFGPMLVRESRRLKKSRLGQIEKLKQNWMDDPVDSYARLHVLNNSGSSKDVDPLWGEVIDSIIATSDEEVHNQIGSRTLNLGETVSDYSKTYARSIGANPPPSRLLNKFSRRPYETFFSELIKL